MIARTPLELAEENLRKAENALAKTRARLYDMEPLARALRLKFRSEASDSKDSNGRNIQW